MAGGWLPALTQTLGPFNGPPLPIVGLPASSPLTLGALLVDTDLRDQV